MWCSLSISNHMRLVDVHQVRAHSVTSSDAFHDLLDEFTLALDNFILVLDQFIVVALNVSERFVLAFDQLDKFTLIVDHFFWLFTRARSSSMSLFRSLITPSSTWILISSELLIFMLILKFCQIMQPLEGGCL